ncbi:hypothetical protein [Streptomyces prasinopilosus]|uniref:Uncharacterized protein n=1 Tax=Streptomyces prasinopilosus TaxID=67344 RepID=A0A1G6SL33_9ACTN|nr:hypothetical protein [Streptomyces prasinopilosus]SDD17589.1 hypothetical protein SAMN05216505_105376 [Streptomyces prasinopilosus]
MTTPSTSGFRPTHVVPGDGMPAWEALDPAGPVVGLDPLLPVRLVERRGDWSRVLCSNGWSAWVDGRLLVTVPQDPPAPGAPAARAADPRPLLSRAEEALAGYRAAVEALADGRLDGEGFRARTRGLRAGLVVDGESLWLYDPDHARWVYTDGTRLHTYATDDPPADDPARVPGASSSPGQAPTRTAAPDRGVR